MRSGGKRQVRMFDVADYGAVGDGVTLDTRAIQRAIDEAAVAGRGSQVLLRGGKKYLTGSLALKGNIDFHLADDAQILASTNPEDYTIVGLPRVAASQPTTAPRNDRSLFTAIRAGGLRISGTGSIDGCWREFMEKFDEENEWWLPKKFRPPMFQFVGCTDLELRDIQIIGSPVWTVHLLGCRHVRCDHVTIRNQMDVPNCDGINPDHSQDVEIANCNITCGDDAIAVKASRYGNAYGPTHNIRVRDCVLLTQDSGVKIGTETTQDIYDVRFERCEIKSSCRGLCIQLRDEGNVRDVDFRDITFVSRYHSAPWWGRGEAISFTALPRSPETKVGTIQHVRVSNVTGRAENSVRINGSDVSRIRDIVLDNVAVTMDRWTKYPGGLFDNRPTTAQDGIEPHTNPGYYLRHADDVTLRNCKIAWGENRPDYFTHALRAEDCKNLSTPGFAGSAAHPDRYTAVSIT